MATFWLGTNQSRKHMLIGVRLWWSRWTSASLWGDIDDYSLADSMNTRFCVHAFTDNAAAMAKATNPGLLIEVRRLLSLHRSAFVGRTRFP